MLVSDEQPSIEAKNAASLRVFFRMKEVFPSASKKKSCVFVGFVLRL